MYSTLAIGATIACSLWASATDLRSRKIRNVCSVGLLCAGVAFQLIFWLQGDTSGSYVVIVVAGGGALAYLTHVLRLTAPGDAKLFWAASVALPPSLFSSPRGYEFPLMVLATNVFVLYFFILVGAALIRTTGSEKARAFRAALVPRSIAGNVSRIFGFIGLATLVGAGIAALKQAVSLPVGPVFQFLLTMTAFAILSRVAERHNRPALVPILGISVFCASFIVAGFAVPQSVAASLPVFVGVYVVAFGIVRPLALYLASALTIRSMPIEALEVGMIPAESIRRYGSFAGDYYARATAHDPPSPANAFVIQDGKPMASEPVERMKSLHAQGELDALDGDVRVHRTIPFAPFIAVGVVATILLKGPIHQLFVR